MSVLKDPAKVTKANQQLYHNQCVTINFDSILEQTCQKESLLQNLFANSEYFMITDKEVLLDCPRSENTCMNVLLHPCYLATCYAA